MEPLSNYKTCNKCNECLLIFNFYPKRRCCKKCLWNGLKEAQKVHTHNYYIKNRERLNNKRVQLYFKKKHEKQHEKIEIFLRKESFNIYKDINVNNEDDVNKTQYNDNFL
jgi:hypothetical protein